MRIPHLLTACAAVVCAAAFSPPQLRAWQNRAAQQASFDCGERFALDYPGPEDIEVDTTCPDAPRLIVSAQERRVRNSQGGSHYRGQILSVPLTGDHRGDAVPFTIEGRGRDVPFHPHGISLVQSDGGSLLYVINHKNGRSGVVEVFRVEGTRLIARETLRETGLLNRPNDLVALRNGDVYVTNLTTHNNPIADLFTVLIGSGSGSVVRYHNGQWAPAAPNIAYANGIAASPDGQRMFVAGSRDRGIHVFDLKPGADMWQEDRGEFIDVGRGVDNLTWEVPGKTLIAARHPSGWKFRQHAQNPERHSPAEVMRIDVGPPPAITRFRLEPEPQINAVSVGVMWNGGLYLGQVYDAGVHACFGR
jgi:sugar lactone lactonase YvrE